VNSDSPHPRNLKKSNRLKKNGNYIHHLFFSFTHLFQNLQ
jgi:hypothetical protein